MRKSSKKFLAIAACTGLVNLLSSSPVVAALIEYGLEVTIDFGPLTGNTYFGEFAYDNSSFTGLGTESIPLNSFAFNFDGTTYTLSDDPGATVSFEGGVFLGIDYAVNLVPSPTFTSGTLDLSDALFSYNLGGAGLAGTGTIQYNLIPENFSFLTFLLPLGYLTLGRKHQ